MGVQHDIEDGEVIEVFKKGGFLAISFGEYNDYGVSGFFNILKDFDAKDLVIEWLKDSGQEYDDRGGFYEHICSQSEGRIGLIY